MGLQILSPLDRAYQVTTTFYGKVIRGPLTGQQHNSVDYATPVGTPIYAVTDGIIKRADGRDSVGGNRITLDNAANGLTADYAHLQNMYVRVGDSVRAGQLIGTTGNTGTGTTGPHLLFGLKLNGTPIDPLPVINGLVNPASINATLASASKGLFPNGTPVCWPSAGDAMKGVLPYLRKENEGCKTGEYKGHYVADFDAGDLPVIGGVIEVGEFLGKAANPSNWAKFLAIAGGAGMIVWGGILLYNAT